MPLAIGSIAILCSHLTAAVDEISNLTAISSPVNGQTEYVKDIDRGGDFTFYTAEEGNENGGTKFSPNDNTVGAWVRQYSGARNIRWFGASPSATSTVNAAAINAAIQAKNGGEVFIPAGIYQTLGNHDISNCVLVGEGMDEVNGSVLDLTLPGTYGIRVLSSSADVGAGARNLCIYGRSTDQTGVLLERCSHTRVENVQVRYCENGFYFRNSENGWTESNFLSGIRSAGCDYGIRFGQFTSDPGRSSFAYNTIIGTISEMPTGGIGIHIEDHETAPASLYGAFVRVNIYMDEDSSSVALNVEGRLQHSSIFINGERPGGGSHSALTLGSNAIMREVTGQIVVENGSIDIDPNATIANNKLMVVSSNGPVYSMMETLTGASARIATNQSLSSSTWTDLSLLTKFYDRPSNSNNLNSSTGAYECQLKGKYLCIGTVAFTPQSGDQLLGRFEQSGSTSKNFVVFEDTAGSSDDRVMSGAVVIDCEALDEINLAAYTSNASGDTIRNSDSNGFKTHFSVTYLGM